MPKAQDTITWRELEELLKAKVLGRCPVCGSELTYYDGVYRCKQCGWRR